MLTIELIKDRGHLQSLADGWNRLLQASGSDCVFLTWEWIASWWEVYGDGFELLVLVARERNELCGIAPLMVKRVGRLFRSLMFIGQDVDVTPEYLDLIVARGREDEVGAALCRHLVGPLGRRWDHLALERILDDSPNRPVIERTLGELGLELEPCPMVDSPYAQLGASLEALLDGKSHGFRKQYKNKRNRLQRAGPQRILFAGRDVGVDRALDELIRLNRERWQEQGSSFRSERYIRFHRRFCAEAAPRGWLALALLELAGEVVAARYDYVYGGKLWCYQGGWDPRHRDLNLGDNFIALIIEWGISQGLREYDFLAGEAAYKDRWCTSRRSLTDLHGYNRTARGLAMRELRRGKALLYEGLGRVAGHLPEAARARLRALVPGLRLPASPEPAPTHDANTER